MMFYKREVRHKDTENLKVKEYSLLTKEKL